MKMYLRSVFIVLGLFTQLYAADYRSLRKTQSYTVPAGKVAEVLSFTVIQGPSLTVGLKVDGKTVLTPVYNDGSKVPGPVNLFVPGPAVMSIDTSTFDLYLSFRVFDNANNNVNPSNTVVIPSDATGPVKIILESSTDLVSWTLADPGTYGADTPKRFFRLRAERQ